MNAATCEFCHAQFHNEVELSVHIQEEHMKYKKAQSNGCPSTYTEGQSKHHEKVRDVSTKTCFVPGCKSTNDGYPDKLFFGVPLNPQKREKWCRAVNRDPSSLSKTSLYCCENHFDLKNYKIDLQEHKLSGSSRIRLKEDVVPHIFPDTPTEQTLKREGVEDIVQETKDVLTSTETKDDLQCTSTVKTPLDILYISHLASFPIDVEIKIEESDNLDEDDWCINTKNVGMQKFTLYDTISNSNGANNNCSLIKQNQNIEKSKMEIKEKDLLKQRIEAVPFDNNNCLNQKEVKKCLLRNENNDGIVVKTFQCSVCLSSFLKIHDLSKHIRVLHGTTNQLKSLTTDNVKELINVKTKDHLTVDNDLEESFPQIDILPSVSKRNHMCTICNKELSYKSWKTHMKEVHGEERYYCKICGALFKCERYLRRHTLYSHENDIKSYEKPKRLSCPECPKTFKNNDCLAHHIKNCHANSVECQLCFSKLKSSSYLKAHMRRVHYDDGKIHKCKICCKKLKTPRQVKIHMINVHPETLHPCPNCIRLFCNDVQLKIHLKKCKPKAESTSIVANRSNGDDDIDVTVD